MRTVAVVQRKFILYTTTINFYLVFLLLFFTIIYLYTVEVEYKIAKALQSPDDYGGIIAAERYCATKMVKIYEHRKSGNIAFYGIVASWLISSFFYFLEVQAFEMNNTVNIVVCNCSLSIIILLTMFVYLYLYRSNLYHYAQTIATGSLSERYQTAENIRFLRAITESAGYTLAINVFILASFSVTVLVKLGQIDKKWCLCGSERQHSRTRGTVTPSVTTNMATPGTIQSVTGREVPLAATQAEYFNIFNSAWK
uniref:Uncharacterized protein n=1 Tax=Panagrellus redivivus TaxID=6233 RepID=A0A7E4W0Z2_PANRE